MNQQASANALDAYVLIGWFERDNAVSLLTKECIFNPPLTDAQAEALWRPFHDRVEALPVRNATAPANLALAGPEQTVRTTFLKQHAGAANIKDVVKIDPLGLVVHQLIICAGRCAGYQHEVATMQGWINKTIAAKTTPQQVQMTIGPNAMDIDVPHGEFMVNFTNQGYQIVELAKFVSVTRFNQRMLLTAGYHRSYARMSGMAPDAIDRSVLVVVTTDGDLFVSPSSPNHGVRAMCCGLRPPLFADFFDEDFFITVPLKRKRFVLRVRGQMVPVDA